MLRDCCKKQILGRVKTAAGIDKHPSEWPVFATSMRGKCNIVVPQRLGAAFPSSS
jgi:hypothetical protein